MSDIKRYLLSTGKILEISCQKDAESPNDWCDDERFLVYDHRDFYIERDGFDPDSISEVLYNNTHVEDKHAFDDSTNEYDSSYDDYHIFPVYAYIHSGVSLSLNCGNDRWDTSMKGFILIKKVTDAAGFMQDAILITCDEDAAKELAQDLIETWNTYLSGDVYMYSLIAITKCSTCNHVEETIDDSCGGFYGDDINTNGILDDIEGTILKEL